MVTTIEYGVGQLGATTGRIGYRLTSIRGSLDNKSVVDVLLKLRQDVGSAKAVELTGEFEPSDPYFRTLVSSLKSNSYTIQAVIDGSIAFDWLPFVDWLVVELSDTTRDWPAFRCHELRYKLSNPTADEPVLPDQVPLLYVVPEKKLSIADVLEFCDNAKHQWNVAVSPLKQYVRIVWSSEGGRKK